MKPRFRNLYEFVRFKNYILRKQRVDLTRYVENAERDNTIERMSRHRVWKFTQNTGDVNQ